VGKLLPIPDISNKRFPEAKKHEAKGLHQILYRFSPNDYRDCRRSARATTRRMARRCAWWTARGGRRRADAPEEPQLASPIGLDGIDKGMLQEMATRIFGTS
jgi:Mn-containing catalase